MAGSSDRSSAAQSVDSQLSDLYGKINGQDFQANNRFNNYTPMFGYRDMSKTLDNLYNSQAGALRASAGQDIQQSNKSLASRLASQGITGGSILNDQLESSAGNIRNSNYNALQQLGLGRQQQEAGLMNQSNQDQFRTTQAAQSVDLDNMRNLLSKYGLMNSASATRSGNLQNMDDTTWLDDVLGVVNAGAGVYKAFNPAQTIYNFGAKSNG